MRKNHQAKPLSALLFYRFRRRAVFILTANALVLAVVCGLVELGGQAYATMHPSYKVIFLQPDPDVGWTQAPNLNYTWTGFHWYANEFSATVATNSLGFRGPEWSVEKPEGTVRVAVLGDSFIEAVQVADKNTASQVLAQRLSAKRAGPFPGAPEATAEPSYEVLNFGISNYGVGQYLLVWEKFVRQFKPDYVFVYISGIQLLRTTEPYGGGAFCAYNGENLWIRPVFDVENDALVRMPSQDYDRVVMLQKQAIEREHNGVRVSRRPRRFFLGHLYDQVTAPAAWRSYAAPESKLSMFCAGLESRWLPSYRLNKINVLHRLILTELYDDVQRHGGKLVMIDALEYFNLGAGQACRPILDLCHENDIGHVPLTDYFCAAERSGIALRLQTDGHFNEAGNAVLGEAMVQWMVDEAATR